MTQLVWFKRDLRVSDHAPLAGAAAAGTVLPVYVVEPELWRQADASARQWTFLRDSLLALRRDLDRLGLPLVVRSGPVPEVFQALHDRFGIVGLWSHQETGNAWTYDRDRSVAEWARAQGIAWTQSQQHGVFRGLQSRSGWAGRWESLMRQAIPPTPNHARAPGDIDPGAVLEAADLGLAEEVAGQKQSGGRDQALGLLSSFLEYRGAAYHRDMSSPLTAELSCSRLSAHLAAGTVSIREVAQATWQRLDHLRSEPPSASGAERGTWGPALKAFNGRLHWHCHFIQKLEDAPAHEFRNVHSGYDGLREDDFDLERFQAWAEGRTGFPFVDACMRSLRATGWINFRMRAMLTAFASYHLWLHWRETGLHLARLFTDYEPGIHWNQMQMQSGTTGINTVRIYNPVKQSQDQDPEGIFIKRWVPELRGLPTGFIHEPWRLGGVAQEAANFRLGRDYPEPIVDHLAAAMAAREKIYAVRRGPAFRDEADAIQARHGSRKSGLPGQRRRKRRPGDAAQATLDL